MATKLFQRPRILQATAATALGTLAVLFGTSSYLTRDTFFRDFSTQNDTLFGTDIYKRSNPHDNTTLHDLCVRRVPLERVRPELLDDARQGGSKLVQEFCRGMWSGRVFAPQRTMMSATGQRGRAERELWTSSEIRQGEIATGTIIAGEFDIVSTTPTSIVLRGGQAPSAEQQAKARQAGSDPELRDVDVLAELAVDIDTEQKVAEFRFKGIFWCGTGIGSKPPLPKALDPLHRFYAAALLREASECCLR